MASWLQDCRKIIHMDFHMPEFPKEAIHAFDPVAFVGELKRANVDAVAVFAKDHFGMSFYPTQVGHTHTGLDRDFLGEVTAEAHRQGIRVLAYLSAAWDKWNVEHNPDFRQCGPDGAPLLKNAEWEWGCLNSPYKEESLFPQVIEIMAKYPVDGFFFDAVMHQEGGCYCPYCRRKYERMYGAPLVKDGQVVDPALHRAFMADSVEAFIRETVSIIHARMPEAVLCMNSSWELGQDRRVVDANDLVIIEAQPAHLEVGAYENITLQCRYARTLGKPFQIVTVRFAEGWGEMTLKETEQLKYEFSLIQSQGGIVCCGDQVYPDGTLEPRCYDRLADAFSYIDGKAQAATTAPIKECAMYHQAGRAFPYSVRGFSAGLMGLHKALYELHVQYDIIDQHALPSLSDYRLLIVPNDTSLCAEEIEAIARYTKDGGRVLLFGGVLWNGGAAAALSSLLGIRAVEPLPYLCGYYSAQSPMLPAMPLLVKSWWNKVELAGAQEFAALHLPITMSAPPHRGFRSAYPPASRESRHPAATLMCHGEGRALYVAADVPGVYSAYGHAWLKQIIAHCVDALLPDALVRTDAPPFVETNVTRKGDTAYLHIVGGFLNRPCMKSYAPVETPFRLPGVTFSLRLPSVQRASIAGRAIPFEMNDGRVCFSLDLAETYTLVQFDLG